MEPPTGNMSANGASSTTRLLILLLVALSLYGVRERQTLQWLATPYRSCTFAGSSLATCIKRVAEERISVKHPFVELASMDHRSIFDEGGRLCHVPGHLIGRDWMRVNGNDITKVKSVLRYANTHPNFGICTRGFMHGVMQVAPLEQLGDISAIFTATCGGLSNSQIELCAHGIGHRLIVAKTPLKNAYQQCRTLSMPIAAYQCKDGVQMQFRMGDGPRQERIGDV